MEITALRLDNKTIREVDRIAKELQRSRSYIIRKAIQTYIDEYLDYEIALQRLKDKDDLIISSEEMNKEIEK